MRLISSSGVGFDEGEVGGTLIRIRSDPVAGATLELYVVRLAAAT
jgi:hypothetical protein